MKNNRRSLTPATGTHVPQGAHHMRRESARREVSERVYLHGPDGEIREGWALNASRGGVRVILEEKIELGSEHEVIIGDKGEGGTSVRGRIVWVQEEPDGVVAGVEFVNASGLHKSVPPPPSEPPEKV